MISTFPTSAKELRLRKIHDQKGPSHSYRHVIESLYLWLNDSPIIWNCSVERQDRQAKTSPYSLIQRTRSYFMITNEEQLLDSRQTRELFLRKDCSMELQSRSRAFRHSQHVSHVQKNKKRHLFLVIIIPLLHRKQKKEEEAKEGGREPAAKSNTFHH